ncbi:MAG TPA: PQQ-binding-like beta-propeller repeat protein [Methylomirabilota bacterium]|nr:PQQ-binding-like beta-propeller repeat protein [Methylomirabilota bacterium]
MNRSLAVLLTASFAVSAFAANFDWPQWRGPNRDDVSKETGLLKSWPTDGPKRVWIYEKGGNGYSGPAIANGKLFTVGTRDDSEVLLALDANTGKELWAAPLGPILANDWGGGPRGTPTVDGNHVYALSGKGNLACVTVADGKIVWQKAMTSLGGKVPGWGYTESVLVDGERIVCTPGGAQGALAALNKKNGEVLWRSTEFKDGAQYSSVMPAKINSADTYVQLTMQSIVGISPKDGKQLWRSPFPGKTAVIPTPIVRDNFVYVVAGYGVGCKQIKVNSDNTVETVYENKVMKNHHGGVILVGDYIYGHADPGWTCQNFKTGEEVWSHRGFGKGAVTYADGMLYCVEEGSGTVVLAEASPAGWKEHGRFKLDPQSTIRHRSGRIWTHPVISNGKLYLRDQDLIYCYDVKS